MIEYEAPTPASVALEREPSPEMPPPPPPPVKPSCSKDSDATCRTEVTLESPPRDFSQSSPGYSVDYVQTPGLVSEPAASQECFEPPVNSGLFTGNSSLPNLLQNDPLSQVLFASEILVPVYPVYLPAKAPASYAEHFQKHKWKELDDPKGEPLSVLTGDLWKRMHPKPPQPNPTVEQPLDLSTPRETSAAEPTTEENDALEKWIHQPHTEQDIMDVLQDELNFLSPHMQVD